MSISSSPRPDMRTPSHLPTGASGPLGNSWAFQPADLDAAPSLRPGTSSLEKHLPMSIEAEHQERGHGCSFIFAVGIAVSHPQLVICTACMYFQRFYMIERFQSFPFYDIAATCLFLAGKAEESVISVSNLARICAQKALKQRDPSSHELKKWEELIIHNESIVLEALCFDLVIEHPFADLLAYTTERNVPRKTVAAAWGFINEAYRTPLPLLFPPKTLAAAALATACAYNGAESRNPDGQGWWVDFATNSKDLAEAVGMILEQAAKSCGGVPTS